MSEAAADVSSLSTSSSVGLARSCDAAHFASDAVSPVRLHRHALESVFAFLALADLVSLLRVSHPWQSVVGSMRSLGTEIPLNFPCGDEDTSLAEAEEAFLRRVGQSSPALLRHVGQLRLNEGRGAAELSGLLQPFTHLHTLRCDITSEYGDLVLPPRLRDVALLLYRRHSNQQDEPDEALEQEDAREISAALRSVCALPLLSDLSFCFSGIARGAVVDWSPLTGAHALRELRIVTDDHLDDEAVDVLRTLTQLRALHYCNLTPSSFLRLLRPPHDLQWEIVPLPRPLTSASGRPIVHCPSLTDLHVCLDDARCDFLRPPLPNLRRLTLALAPNSEVQPDVEGILQALHAQEKLTALELWGVNSDAPPLRFTAAHLSAALAHMPQLTSLSLYLPSAVESLSFLSVGSVTRTLKRLIIDNGHEYPRLMPPSEMVHLHALTALEELHLSCAFTVAVDPDELQQYEPPSRLIPSLRIFEHSWQPTYEDERAADEAADLLRQQQWEQEHAHLHEEDE